VQRLLRIRNGLGSAAKTPDFWAIILAMGFFAVNILTLGQYGLSFDEPAGMDRGRQTLALLGRMLAPGMFELSSSDIFHYHPSFYATCNFVVSQGLIRFGSWDPIAAGHFLNVLTASVGLVTLFYLGKCLFNGFVGLGAVGFMIFFPRFAAHSHYNAKDVPVMVFATLTLLCFCLAMRHRRAKYWVLAGLAFAMSVTSKLDGLFLLPIILVPWLLCRFRNSSNEWRSELRSIGLFLYAAMMFIVLFWPALWDDPLHLFRAVSSFAGQWTNFSISYLGQGYPIDRVPWHYMTVHLAAVTPLASLLFVMIGVIGSFRYLSRRQGMFEHGLLWCWLLFPLLARMKPGALQYDGMRHVFLVVPAIALLAGLGVDQLRKQWAGRTGGVPAVAVALGCCGVVAWLSWQTVQIHPYQGSYLNEGVRLFIRGPRLGNSFDFYSWGTLLKEGIEWLAVNAPPHSSVAVPNHLQILRNYPLRSDLQWEKSSNADFIMLMGWRADLKKRFDSAPLFAVRCYGADLVLIYPRQKD
jgi:hypothetical protein